MREFLHQLQSPANVAAVSFAAAIVAAAGLIAVRSRRMRWIAIGLASFIVAGTSGWIWYNTPRLTDVSDEPRYRALFHTRLCLSREAFVIQWNNHFPSAEPAGFSSATPRSVDDYLAHPDDWQHSPEYIQVYGSLFANQAVPRVLTYGRSGAPLRVVRVVDRYRTENHSHIREVHGEINGRLADVSLLLVGNQKVEPCREQLPLT